MDKEHIEAMTRAEFEARDRRIIELTKERDMYRELAQQLYQPGPCSFDHHGGCQEHLWLDLQPGEECPDGRAQRIFAKDCGKGTAR